jgi:pimeloyl-ACP methyl ester carboxylesterase
MGQVVGEHSLWTNALLAPRETACGPNRAAIRRRGASALTILLTGRTLMKTQDSQTSTSAVRYETARIGGLNVAYREAGNPQDPKLVLLHGFPASSHQYRNLIPALAKSFHVIAPDYPGFGNSDMPDPSTFDYTFDRLAATTAQFLQQKGFDRYGLFVQDYGGPVGFRIVMRDRDALEWLIIQNTNAYEVGFTDAWAGLRNELWKHRTAESEKAVAGLLEFDTIKSVYLHGHRRPELISPDNWNMDFHFMERPNARRVQMDLFYDYRTNVELYPQWQKFLRDRQPQTVIFWGQNDIFFTPEGGEAYLRDLPEAQMHRLDSGHFATEDYLEYIATNIERFHDERVAPVGQTAEAAAS